jgi:ketosteroid isomerase-like protein
MAIVQKFFEVLLSKGDIAAADALLAPDVSLHVPLPTSGTVTARGVHKGEFMGMPPTGKPIVMTGIEIFRLKNGKIAELWGEANLMGLMHQLGILPSSA